MGAAVALFDDASAVRVPRSRFMPVKKCNDLMAVRSDCYRLNTDFRLHQNPDRTLPAIQIQLDKRYFQKIDDFDARFANGVPSLIDCESLIVQGDVAFEADVVIKGQVKIKNNGHRQITVRSGIIVVND